MDWTATNTRTDRIENNTLLCYFAGVQVNPFTADLVKALDFAMLV